MSIERRHAVYTALWLALFGPAVAQDQQPAQVPAQPAQPPAQQVAQPPKPTIIQLMSQGFEIKAVSIIPTTDLPALGMQPGSAPQLIVTLQRGAVSAACQFTVHDWDYQTSAQMNSTNLCDTSDEQPVAAQ